jgi:hypothetical protein
MGNASGNALSEVMNMRIVRFFVWSVLALPATALHCSRHQCASPPQAAMGVTAPQGPSAATDESREKRALELVRLADIQIHDLENSRAASVDDARRASIDEHVAAIARYRDTVLADLTEQSPLLAEDVSSLERTMQSAALSMPQVPPLLPSR